MVRKNQTLGLSQTTLGTGGSTKGITFILNPKRKKKRRGRQIRPKSVFLKSRNFSRLPAARGTRGKPTKSKETSKKKGGAGGGRGENRG